jgi:hypothetical protein
LAYFNYSFNDITGDIPATYAPTLSPTYFEIQFLYDLSLQTKNENCLKNWETFLREVTGEGFM